MCQSSGHVGGGESNLLFDGATVAVSCLLLICALQHEDRIINFKSGSQLDAQNLNNV